jgi:hypothetical protein
VDERAEQHIIVGGELTAPNSVESHLVFCISPTMYEDSPTLVLRLIMDNQIIQKVMTCPYG